MSKAKLLSIFLAVALVFGCVPMLASADSYTAQLVLGTAYEGHIKEDDPFISTSDWDGYAQYFSAELEAGVEYKIVATVSCDTATYMDRAVAVVPLGFTGDPSYEGIAYTSRNYYGQTVTTTLMFSVEEDGVYEVIVWGYCENESTTLYGEDTRLSVLLSDEISQEDYLGMPITDTLTVGTAYNGHILETDPYVDTYDWGGYGKAFAVDLKAGEKYYAYTIAECADADYIDRAISVVPANFTGDFSTEGIAYASSGDIAEASVRFSVEEDGTYYVIVWGYCEDGSTTLYGESTALTVLVQHSQDVILDIATSDDLVKFNADMLDGKYSNMYVILNFLDDIDMTDIAWDDEFLNIYGEVNGNGYTVTNLAGALLGCDGTFSVKDLNMDVDLEFDWDSVYDFGLYARYAKEASFENCHVTGDIAYAGYIEDVGAFIGDVEDVSFENCSFEGSITAANGGYIGGLAGYIWGYNVYFINSYAKAAFFMDVGECVGGVVGYIEDDATFAECYAETNAYFETGYKVGGMVGYIDEYNVFVNCYTEGVVGGTEGLGGMVGVSNCCGDNRFINCYTTVDVSGLDYVGGFIGESYSGDTFANCYSAGTVTYTGDETQSAVSVGTFVGYSVSDISSISFENCFARESASLNIFGEYDDATLVGIYAMDFNDENAVTDLEATLNAYVDESYLDLHAWGGRNESNGPTFVIPEYIESVDVTINGYTIGANAEDLTIEINSDIIRLYDMIVCTDMDEVMDTVVTGAFETGKTYYVGIHMVSNSPNEYSFAKYDVANTNLIGVNYEAIYELGTDKQAAVMFVELKPLNITGDVNGDGKVNLFDYVALKSHVLGKSPLSEDKLVRADVNGDGRINMFDYVALKTLVVKG